MLPEILHIGTSTCSKQERALNVLPLEVKLQKCFSKILIVLEAQNKLEERCFARCLHCPSFPVVWAQLSCRAQGGSCYGIELLVLARSDGCSGFGFNFLAV